MYEMSQSGDKHKSSATTWAQQVRSCRVTATEENGAENDQRRNKGQQSKCRLMNCTTSVN